MNNFTLDHNQKGTKDFHLFMVNQNLSKTSTLDMYLDLDGYQLLISFSPWKVIWPWLLIRHFRVPTKFCSFLHANRMTLILFAFSHFFFFLPIVRCASSSPIISTTMVVHFNLQLLSMSHRKNFLCDEFLWISFLVINEAKIPLKN